MRWYNKYAIAIMNAAHDDNFQPESVSVSASESASAGVRVFHLPFSAALDVLYHQHAERKVWGLLHGFCVHVECNQTRSHMTRNRTECH